MEKRVTSLRVYKIDRHGRETLTSPHMMRIESIVNYDEHQTVDLPLTVSLSEFKKIGHNFIDRVCNGECNQRKVV